MYYQISSIPTPHTPETLQSTEVDFGQFHDVDDEDVVNQKKIRTLEAMYLVIV